jgi:transposase
MKFEEVIGIDVSKKTLDACIHSLQIFTQLPNTKKGYSKLFSWVAKSTGCLLEKALFCFEHTGMYSYALASYAGVAPFPYTSGISIKGKTKVSSLANMRLKSLLSACAVSAIRYDPEMRIYYKRRTATGKHKMNIINAVRNKLLARVFAVVRRGTPYVPMCQNAA